MPLGLNVKTRKFSIAKKVLVVYYVNKSRVFYIHGLVLVLLLSTCYLRAQKKPDFDAIVGKMISYAELTPPDKVYLHTDKDLYANGETIWFKTYVLNGITHVESSKSSVVYVELLNPKDSIIARQKLYAGVDWAEGDIPLPQDMEEGKYLLRAYTKYMLNDKNPVFFQKVIPIWQRRVIPNNPPENILEKKGQQQEAPKNQIGQSDVTELKVQFFPEGGNLVSGLKNGIGLKITDDKGTGIALQGNIVDGRGTQIVPFRSFEFGLASAYFKVETHTEYYAEIDMNGATKKYPLPKPLSKGYALRLSNQGEHILIRVSTNIGNGLKGTFLLGHLRGHQIFKRFEKSASEDTYEAKLLTSELGNGVAHFTLFAPNGEPVCERLTFIENPENQIELSLETDKSNYGFREPVDVDFAVQDVKGEPLDGRFSISVSTGNSLAKETTTIKSWLLLNSDLGGTVENPNYFFEDDSRARDYVLDLLMLTHGWRRFVWKSLSEKGVSPELAFPPEKGIMISGNTTAYDNAKQPLKTIATLNILKQNLHQERVYTNPQGKFSFGPFRFKDSVETVIKAKEVAKNGKGKKEVSIHIDPPFPIVPVNRMPKRQTNATTITDALPYLEEAERKKLNDFKYDPKVTQLDEVVVKEKIKSRKEIINEALSERTMYGDTRHRVIRDSIPFTGISSVFDLLVTVPGVQVIGFAPQQSVFIGSASTRGGPPLILIDGMPVSVGLAQNIPVESVLFIDVLKNIEAAIYGVRGSGGVIAIYTKRGEYFGEEPQRYPGVANFTVPGFYKSREFYSPNYATNDVNRQKPDYRTTLHWAPEINIQNMEKAKFYTGDTPGKYVVRIVGITDDGRPVNALRSFIVVDD